MSSQDSAGVVRGEGSPSQRQETAADLSLAASKSCGAMPICSGAASPAATAAAPRRSSPDDGLAALLCFGSGHEGGAVRSSPSGSPHASPPASAVQPAGGAPADPSSQRSPWLPSAAPAAWSGSPEWPPAEAGPRLPPAETHQPQLQAPGSASPCAVPASASPASPWPADAAPRPTAGSPSPERVAAVARASPQAAAAAAVWTVDANTVGGVSPSIPAAVASATKSSPPISPAVGWTVPAVGGWQGPGSPSLVEAAVAEAAAAAAAPSEVAMDGSAGSRSMTTSKSGPALWPDAGGDGAHPWPTPNAWTQRPAVAGSGAGAWP